MPTLASAPSFMVARGTRVVGPSCQHVPDDWFTRPEAAMTIDLMVSVADYSNPEDLLTVRRQISELLVESGRGTQ